MLYIKDFNVLKKNLKKDFSGLKTVKVAILGDSATQLLTKALRATGFDLQLDLQIWEADFNQIEVQVANASSELYQFSPDYVIVFKSTHKLLTKYNQSASRENIADNALQQIAGIFTRISMLLATKFIFLNFAEIDDTVYGNYAIKTRGSFIFQLRKLNYELMEYAAEHLDFFLIDLVGLQNTLGKARIFDPALYINTDMTLRVDALPRVSAKIISVIAASLGNIKKCVILDLDNTLWGGVIGDDGLEHIQIGGLGIGKAFTELQHWLKKLKDRGVILAVCSKNTESVAKQPFSEHPDMVLKLTDFAVFTANWENKADNIRKIQQILNIGFDSMVFLDDNPFERTIVRENIPEICVPELPADPAEYLEYLYSLNLFETGAVTAEDMARTESYQKSFRIAQIQQEYTDENQFLESLEMRAKVEGFHQFNMPRIAQLTLRSNQFNLRTIRYSEAEIESLSLNKNVAPFAFSLADKFGDNGLICVVILRKEDELTFFIDTWLMSCRVLKRGMENFVLNTLADFCKNEGISYLKGEYIPTPKNGIVQNHYPDLGFTNDQGNWVLDINSYRSKTCHIN